MGWIALNMDINMHTCVWKCNKCMQCNANGWFDCIYLFFFSISFVSAKVFNWEVTSDCNTFCFGKNKWKKPCTRKYLKKYSRIRDEFLTARKKHTNSNSNKLFFFNSNSCACSSTLFLTVQCFAIFLWVLGAFQILVFFHY